MSSNKLLSVCLLICCLVALAAAQPPQTSQQCPRNERYYDCGANCQTECRTLRQPCLIRHFRCPNGCYCISGYARNSVGTCIPINQCSNRR